MPMSPALNRRRGIFGAAQPAPPMAEEPQKPKFFGEGGTGRTIAGVLGDALAQLGGFDPVFAPEMQRRREMTSALRQQEQQRQQGLQDWVWKQQYEAAHPKPVNNDTVADYNFWKQTLNPEQFNQWLQNRINPPQYRQGPDGQFYRIDTSPTGAPPTFTAQDWDNAAPVQGGQSATPTGGFRQFP